MPRRAAGRAGGWTKFGAGLARVGGLEDFAAAAGVGLVARRRAAGAMGQRFRAVHFVEMGFVDFGGATGTTAAALPLTPTLSPRRAGRGGGGTAAHRTAAFSKLASGTTDRLRQIRGL